MREKRAKFRGHLQAEQKLQANQSGPAILFKLLAVPDHMGRIARQDNCLDIGR